MEENKHEENDGQLPMWEQVAIAVGAIALGAVTAWVLCWM